MNFWFNPHHIVWTIDLITVFLMGIIHGITPDEHTWPITFSYSIGSYSTRGGMRAGLFFSIAFTLQRAIASELAYFALAGFLMRAGVEQVIYIIVGLVMLLSGYFILYRRKTLHLFPWLDRFTPALPTDKETVPVKLALIHGFIAGWGTGAFATIIYTVISPQMPSPWIAFLPGLFYGMGTIINTLFIGGILFAFAGVIELIMPKLTDWTLPTGLHIYNLNSINVALLLIIFVVGGAGGYSIFRAMRIVQSSELQ